MLLLSSLLATVMADSKETAFNSDRLASLGRVVWLNSNSFIVRRHQADIYSRINAGGGEHISIMFHAFFENIIQRKQTEIKRNRTKFDNFFFLRADECHVKPTSRLRNDLKFIPR